VTTGNRTRRPTFPPSVWKVHDITVNNADCTNNFTVAWNRGFETLLSENIRPSGHASSCCRRQMLPMQPASSWNTQMKDDVDGSRCNDGCTVSAWSTTMNNERIEYKLLSLTYKVLTTSQPSYLNNLISVQPHRSTCSSVVTLSRPPTISSLKITDRSFRYAAPRLWNQLTDSFRQPCQSCLDSLPHSLASLSLLSSPLSSSITPSLFHSRLKTYLFNKSFPP